MTRRGWQEWSPGLLGRVARLAPATALPLVHLLDRCGLLQPGPAPEEIAETLGWPMQRRALERMAASVRVARAKNRVVRRLTRPQLAEITRLHGSEWLQRQSGRPTILIFWHLHGRSAAITAALARHGVSVVAARAGKSRKRRGDDLYVRAFDVSGFEGRRAFLEHAAARLREGGTVLLAADGLQRDRGIEVRLFGRQAWFARTFAILARITGAEVLPVVYPWGTRRIDVHVHGPLPMAGGDSASSERERDKHLANAAAAWLEGHLRQHPEQAGALVGARFWNERGHSRRPARAHS